MLTWLRTKENMPLYQKCRQIRCRSNQVLLHLTGSLEAKFYGISKFQSVDPLSNNLSFSYKISRSYFTNTTMFSLQCAFTFTFTLVATTIDICKSIEFKNQKNINTLSAKLSIYFQKLWLNLIWHFENIQNNNSL